jgi:molecular chaperone IbpA
MTITGRFGPMVLNNSLGFENFIRDVESLLNDKPVTTFPPHNIIKTDEHKYIVELAVAGFSRDEIDIEVQENTLTIKGEKADKTELNYLHRGIGTRSFTKSIAISDTIAVKGAEYKDGILRIGLENIIPEHRKPRKVDIGEELLEFTPQLLQETKKAA